MTKKPTNSKRKRRSFWEPESPVLQKWIDDQKDLGTSLQLIIVDAIRNYGEGDAISAYLTARETAENEPVPMTPRKAVPKQAQSPAPVSRAVTPSETGDTQPVKTPIAESAPPKPEPLVAQAPDVSEVPPETAAKPPEVRQQAPAPAPVQEQPEEEEYDPIKIMMADVGSNYGG